jgi:hypothetical protein
MIYAKNELVIKSTVLNNIPGLTPSTKEPSRHLYF